MAVAEDAWLEFVVSTEEPVLTGVVLESYTKLDTTVG